MIRQPFKARTSDELIALLSAVATAIFAVIIIMMLYFGREIIIPIALAILLSFALAPLVGLLQRIWVPRGLAVVSVVIIAFAFIFAMGSLLASQLTQLAGDLPRYQSTISEKIQSFRETTAGRGTLERASGMLKDLSKELDKPKDAASALGAGASPKPLPHSHPFLWKSVSLTQALWRACRALFPRCFIRSLRQASSSFLSSSFCFNVRIFVIG